MANLPIDPAEYPGTPEYEEIYQERHRRALQRRLEAAQDEHDRRYLRHA